MDHMVLWTGGLDSTYFVSTIFQEPINIQPIYLRDNRICENNELTSIYKIKQIIETKKNKKCNFNKLIQVEVESIESDLIITESFNRLKNNYFIGSQYEYIARLAKSLSGLYLSIENSIYSKALKCIQSEGCLKLTEEENVKYYIIDKDRSTLDLVNVFGNIRFPKEVFEHTKHEEIQSLEKNGLREILDFIWFCHRPVNNLPCGICNPCKSYIDEGLTGYFTRIALLKNKINIFIEKLKIPARAVKRKLFTS